MVQSCSDMASDVMEALGEAELVRADDCPTDNPGRSTSMALDVIRRLVAIKDMALVLATHVVESSGRVGDEVAMAREVLKAIERIRPRFLSSDGYQHCFVGSRAVCTRWVMDLDSGELVVAEVQADDGVGWRRLHRDEVSDLLGDVQENGVRECPEDFDAKLHDEMPEWASEAVV